jgi:Arc/MetJ-type ribon-helix-helix transcriptional regulator
MPIQLPHDLEQFVRTAVARGRFGSENEALVEAVRLLREREPTSSQAPETPAGQKPIWEVFQEISATVPDEEWAKVPEDSSAQLDHYVYGAPKRPVS